MKVAYYCQHVLGIGHFHRSLEICRAIARHHLTTLIVGGPPVVLDFPGIEVLRLPGLQMDSSFTTMVPCNPAFSLEAVKTARIDQLFAYFQTEKPDIFISELYPFGRKAFKFELDPLLAAISEGTLPHCLCYCSVRDILVEKKSGREKFEQRVVQLINSYFDGILVHADPAIITLDETFSRLDDIHIPLHYTGFVTSAEPRAQERQQQSAGIRKKLTLAPTDKLIVASIGGGSVGSELLDAAIAAVIFLQGSLSAHLQIFCGPYYDTARYQSLLAKKRPNITIDRFTDHLPAWLATADLSISMAGYNTCMNLIQAGIPALVYPFGQNREQRLRAERLGKKFPMTILTQADLAPELFAGHIVKHMKNRRVSAEISLDGAEQTASQLNIWNRRHQETPRHE